MASPGKILCDTHTPPERNNPVEGGGKLSTKQRSLLEIWYKDFAPGSSVSDERVTALAQVIETKPALVLEYIDQISKSHLTKEQAGASSHQPRPSHDDSTLYLTTEANDRLSLELRLQVDEYVTACYRRRSQADKRRSVNTGPYRCTFGCGYCTKRVFDWRRHEETHGPQELWMCSLCIEMGTRNPFLVNRKDKLLKHINDKHGSVTEKTLDSSKVDFIPRAELKCPYCETESGTWDERCKHVLGHFEDEVESMKSGGNGGEYRG